MSDKLNKNLNSNNHESFKSIGFFNNGEHFHYVFKKTEKIVHALYLVTNHLKDTEPLKIELRERGLAVLSISLELNAPDLSGESSLAASFFSSIFELLPFITIASVSGHISYANASLIHAEIDSLILFLKDRLSDNFPKKGLILSEDFFATEMPSQLPDISSQKNFPKNASNTTHIPVIDKRNSRQKSILDLLKKQSDLTVKDFARVVLGCSEKTIQRELNHLVEQGIVKKEGERRWSKYSLK